jgi:hypothetical protein
MTLEVGVDAKRHWRARRAQSCAVLGDARQQGRYFLIDFSVGFGVAIFCAQNAPGREAKSKNEDQESECREAPRSPTVDLDLRCLPCPSLGLAPCFIPARHLSPSIALLSPVERELLCKRVDVNKAACVFRV